MTWIIGACPMMGAYAITVSDIQVTFEDGRTFDLVRKAYGVGPNLIGGFAGSVFIGFELLSSISGFLHHKGMPKNAAWHPAWVAENWGPIARNVFERTDEKHRTRGSQFVLVGPDPVEEVGIPGRAMPYLCKFSAPDFEPEITRGGNSAISIGSGAQVPEYTEELKRIMDPYGMENGGFLQLEVGNTGGWALGINVAISFMLDRNPVPGISQHVHTHVASREGFQVMNSDRTINLGTDEEQQIRMPRVAHSFAEFVKIAGAQARGCYGLGLTAHVGRAGCRASAGPPSTMVTRDSAVGRTLASDPSRTRSASNAPSWRSPVAPRPVGRASGGFQPQTPTVRPATVAAPPHHRMLANAPSSVT